MRVTTYLSTVFAMLPVTLTLQECYVCLGTAKDSPELEHQFPEETLPVCQRGILPPPKQCPPRYKGCLTQYKGELVQRSCGELSLTICQQANQVEYCYCEGNLCNDKEKELPSTPKPSDDEDDEKGSGEGQEPVNYSSTGLNIYRETPKPTRSLINMDNKLGPADSGKGSAGVTCPSLSFFSTIIVTTLRWKT